MATPTIRLRVTDKLQAQIERLWNCAPEFRDDLPTTVLAAITNYADEREARLRKLGMTSEQPTRAPIEQPQTAPIEQPQTKVTNSNEPEW